MAAPAQRAVAALRTADGSSATVDGATTGLGATLVNSHGHTIYLFKKDTGTKSACSGVRQRMGAGPCQRQADRRRRREDLARSCQARPTGTRG